ncbi:cupin [Alicyclobacillus contaminans]|uniref:cupin domain-containing protein n=1 Tax=Alicyclobacillus contaminans TaxID=392016 RepID=UPI000687A54C|nr:cupin domain-containing protein [Alicyclobacillus contaminans]GMA49937.1 cupin [Alicyclobacillus contaminans]
MKSSKQTAEHYTWGSGCDGWHLVKRENLSVIHERMPPGTSEVRHYHNRSRQFFFVLTGTATLVVGEERHTIHPWEGVEVPPGQLHQMRNESEDDVEFLVISHPKSHGDRVVLDRHETGGMVYGG